MKKKWTRKPGTPPDREDRVGSRALTRDEEHIMNAMGNGIKMLRAGDFRVSVHDFLTELNRRGFKVVPKDE